MLQPAKYTVVEGDCVSCIAKKLGITKQFIYDNNPGLQDDKLKIGNQLDVTVLKPTLSVKTTEKVVQNQEIQYDTEYVKDDSTSRRRGSTDFSREEWSEESYDSSDEGRWSIDRREVVNEEIIDQPVTAKVKKGTKVIKGEGTQESSHGL